MTVTCGVEAISATEIKGKQPSSSQQHGYFLRAQYLWRDQKSEQMPRPSPTQWAIPCKPSMSNILLRSLTFQPGKIICVTIPFINRFIFLQTFTSLDDDSLLFS